MKSKIDERGKTIGVRHYLNKSLKARTDFFLDVSPNEHRYPIYVQITVKGRATKTRSILDLYLSDEEFENFKISHSQDLTNEILVIRRAILREKPFETDNYRIGWTGSGQWDDYSIGAIVISSLMEFVLNLLKDKSTSNMIRNERFWKRAKTHNLPCRPLDDEEFEKAYSEYIEETSSGTGYHEFNMWSRFNDMVISTSNPNFTSMFFSFMMPEMKQLRDDFKPEFWDFSNYEYGIKEAKKAELFIIDDLMNGRFDKLFLETWHDESALRAIHEGFNRLNEVSPYFHHTLSKLGIQFRNMS